MPAQKVEQEGEEREEEVEALGQVETSLQLQRTFFNTLGKLIP